MQLSLKKGGPQHLTLHVAAEVSLHPSKKTVPFNDPNGIPQQHPSVGPTRCWWRCKPPDIPSLRNGSMQGEVWVKRCWNQQHYPKEIQLQPTNLRRNLQITFNTQKPWSHGLLLFKMINIYQTSMPLGSSILNEQNALRFFWSLKHFNGFKHFIYYNSKHIYVVIYMCHGINCNLRISDSMVRESHQPSSRGFYTSHNVFWLPMYGLLTVTHLPP